MTRFQLFALHFFALALRLLYWQLRGDISAAGLDQISQDVDRYTRKVSEIKTYQQPHDRHYVDVKENDE